MEFYQTAMMRGKTEEEIQCVPVFNWRARKGYIQHNRMGRESRCSGETDRRR